MVQRKAINKLFIQVTDFLTLLDKLIKSYFNVVPFFLKLASIISSMNLYKFASMCDIFQLDHVNNKQLFEISNQQN